MGSLEDTLAVKLLENRLYIYRPPSHPYPLQWCYVIHEQPLSLNKTETHFYVSAVSGTFFSVNALEHIPQPRPWPPISLLLLILQSFN